jgi:predicted nucleotidyltransferase
MNSKIEIIKKLSELKPVLSKEYNVKTIGLFGSFSDETFNDESDIDLLVELNEPNGWDIISLEIFLEDIFNRKIDLITKNAIREPLRNNIYNNIQFI